MSVKIGLQKTPLVSEILARFVSGLGPEAFDRVLQVASLVPVPRGGMLVREGEVATTFGYVIEGALGMARTTAEGKTHLSGLLLPGDCYGRLFDGPMPHSVAALTNALVLIIEREVYELILGEMPTAENALIVSMIGDLDAARAWVLVLSSVNLVERVAAFLEILVQRQQSNRFTEVSLPVTVRLPLGRKDLARCLGIRPESLSRAIHRLKKLGIIEVVNTNVFRVPDRESLLDAAGGAFKISSQRKDQAGGRTR
ncbi:MAG: Crp/Fnr family transcriptional regulator [Allorhizobium sp.]